MQFHSTKIEIPTDGRRAYNVTAQIDREIAAKVSKQNGLCNLFLHHTSASLMLCENSDPSVLRDLETFFAKLVPDGESPYQHNQEGPDDMPAHIRSVLTQNSLAVPFAQGKLQLGTWQGVFLWEHRLAPHRRTLTISLLAA